MEHEMSDDLAERVDILVADALAVQTALSAIVRQLPTESREAALAECREVIDALLAHPDTNPIGHRVFERAEGTLRAIFSANAG